MQLPAGFEHRYFMRDGARLHYLEGPDSGPPLVLIPGQSMPCESYLRVLPLLAQRFHCYAVDVRGHGLSARTPGHYRFSVYGEDLVAMLRQVVGRPAILTGNSSGGVIAAYAAAHAPELVCALMPEDPPFFSSEWPAMSTGYVHDLFGRCVEYLDRPERDLAGFFAGFEVPTGQGQRVMRLPRWLARFIAWRVARFQHRHPGQRVDLKLLPFQLRLFLRSLSEYDVKFTRAFWDGSACDIDHAAILRGIRCPMLLLHADWLLHERLGLVGAMTDAQAQRAVALVAGARYERIRGGHVIHQEQPARFVRLLTDFALSAGCLGR